MIEDIGIQNSSAQNLQQFLQQMREFVASRQSDAILLAEANVSAEKIPTYFCEGDRMQMLFNFLLNQHLFLALARQEADFLKEGLKALPEIPHNCQWLNFVRHHDELTLDRLSEDEQQEVFAAFAPRQEMQIFGRGIRRRLPPMVQNDRRRMEMIYSLAFSLPGIPLLRYGDEIAMGDDLDLPGRDSVRTPMQWSDQPNGGFSTASPEAFPRPMIAEGKYGYPRVNVAFEQRQPDSLLNWMEHLIRTRRQCPEFGAGRWRILPTDESAVLAHFCETDQTAMLALHNLADRPCVVDLPEFEHHRLMEVFNDNFSFIDPEQSYPLSTQSTNALSLNAYGYRWFRVSPKSE